MIKYELIPQQLLREGVITEAQLFTPGMPDDALLKLTHDPEYLLQLRKGTLDPRMIRRIGFPLTQALYERECLIVQGSVECAVYALRHGVALNVAGGTHHAYADKGEGFCLMNDMAVAANYLLHTGMVKKILFVDLDVHQGNGTAKLFEHNPAVFTFSMHGRNNYPFHKEKSDLDIELEDGTGDEYYLEALEKNLKKLLTNHEPGMVFFNSGVDVLATDKLGKLKLSETACASRDAMVFKACKEFGVPVVAAMGGGYSAQVADIVNAHCNTFRMAAKFFFD